MTSALFPSTPQLLSAKAASGLVPYSRDYIARIAREGKIAAVQIDRQWFVEATSLNNFYEQALLEEAVRKRHLSNKRKLELEVKDRYQSRVAFLRQKRKTSQLAAAIVATLVVLGGLSSGLLFLEGNSAAYLASLANVEAARNVVTPLPGLLPDTTKSNESFFETMTVEEVTSNVSLEGGIVLLPQGILADQTDDVAALFSDVATVTMTSSSTGMIQVETDGVVTRLTFVRVPVSETSDSAMASSS